MARRKRASMREGPLADLFRSTVERDEAVAAARIALAALGVDADGALFIHLGA